MTKLVAIDNTLHRKLTIDTNKTEQQWGELHLVPVVLSEFTHLVVEYPIVLTKNGDTGQFICAAMLGFENNENLFWQQGHWQSLYLPLQIQRQPFFIGEARANEAKDTWTDSAKSPSDKEYVICFNQDSSLVVNNEKGEALFTPTGEETKYFQQAKNLLTQMIQGETDNRDFIATLQALDLIQPMSLVVTFADGKSTRLNGLYTIEQEKLANLTDEQMLLLYKKAYLPSIYTMIASLGQIYALIEKRNKRDAT